MSTTSTTRWIHAGLLALPVYGALTLWSAREPQPNPDERYEEWSRFVTTPEYVLTHVLGSGLGLVLAIFGVFALGAYLAPTRAGRLGLSAMVLTGTGMALFLFVGGVAAFASPEEGQAYLAGVDGIDELPDIAATTAMTLVTLVSVVLSLVGHVMLGIAVWRSGALPRWAGFLWATAAVLMYPFGLVLGALVTGATPPTVLVGAALIVVSGVWMFRHAAADEQRPRTLDDAPATHAAAG